MAKSNRAYRSAKRTKELKRQKKREEKRRKKLEKDRQPDQGGLLDAVPVEGETAGATVDESVGAEESSDGADSPDEKETP